MKRRASMFAKRRDRGDEDERILPLINIVFLLLIFFMVVGRLSAADPFEIVPTTSASDGKPANEPMLIAIGPAAELALDGTLIDEEALFKQIEAAGPEAQIRIKSDGRVAAAQVVALIERLRNSGIARVRLMTVPTREEALGAGVGAGAGGAADEGTGEG
ncbi:MAG: biopolymer transporter ExbD [Pseudomonadota bacterium]